MLTGIIAVIIFLSILVLAHELGHFLAAKRFGLLVEEFGFGLPPRIWGKKIGETIYSINALPFGGFVKIYGEDREDEVQSESDNPNLQKATNKIIEAELSYKLNGLFFEAHKQIGRFAREKQYGDFLEKLFKQNEINYKREVPISIAGNNSNKADFIIEDKILIELKSNPFISKSDYYQTKRYLDATNLELGLIVNFREDFLKPRRVLRYKSVVGDLKQFVDSDEVRSFGSLSIWRRIVIIAAGVIMNFLLGWLVISIVFSIGLPNAIVITEIFPNSPAEQIGLMAGDRIIDTSVNDFIKFTNDNRGKEIAFEIERNGEIKEFLVTPRVNPPSGEGALGIGLVEAGAPKQNIFSSFWEGLKTSFQIIQMILLFIFDIFRQLFTTGSADLGGVSGPVGIVKVTAQAGTLGFAYLLQLLALISFNLVVINIMPFPALDGGRLLFLLIEKIKGSPLPMKFERYSNAVGMILLLTLMAVITIRDIVRF